MKPDDTSEGTQQPLKHTRWDNLLVGFGATIFAVMLVLVLVQVLVRYLGAHLGLSLPWTEELARLLLVLTIFVGAAVALLKNEHITVMVFSERYPPKVRQLFELVCYLLILGIALFLAKGSWDMMHRMMRSPTGAVPWITVGYIYAVIFATCLLMSYYSLRWILRCFQKLLRAFKGQNPLP